MIGKVYKDLGEGYSRILGCTEGAFLATRDSPPPLCFRAWYWGYLSIYDSGGYIHELGTTLRESNACLQGLQQNNWISNRWVMRAGETQVGN